jgi:hypothetical protein
MRNQDDDWQHARIEVRHLPTPRGLQGALLHQAAAIATLWTVPLPTPNSDATFSMPRRPPDKP